MQTKETTLCSKNVYVFAMPLYLPFDIEWEKIVMGRFL